MLSLEYFCFFNCLFVFLFVCLFVCLLCCAVLCCAVLCCAVLCCVVLCCVLLCCGVVCFFCLFVCLFGFLLAKGPQESKSARYLTILSHLPFSRNRVNLITNDRMFNYDKQHD